MAAAAPGAPALPPAAAATAATASAAIAAREGCDQPGFRVYGSGPTGDHGVPGGALGRCARCAQQHAQQVGQLEDQAGPHLRLCKHLCPQRVSGSGWRRARSAQQAGHLNRASLATYNMEVCAQVSIACLAGAAHGVPPIVALVAAVRGGLGVHPAAGQGSRAACLQPGPSA